MDLIESGANKELVCFFNFEKLLSVVIIYNY